MRRFVLDAGHPWGLRCGPHEYFLREHIRGDIRPVMYDTWNEAIEEARRLSREERKPFMVRSYEDGKARPREWWQC